MLFKNLVKLKKSKVNTCIFIYKWVLLHLNKLFFFLRKIFFNFEFKFRMKPVRAI